MSRLPTPLATSGWRIERTVQQDRRVHIFKLMRGEGKGAEHGFLKTLVSTAPADRRMFDREREALEGARFPPPLSMPELLEAGETFLLTRFSPGVRLGPAHTPEPAKLDLLARGLEALRRAELPPRFTAPRPNPRKDLNRLAVKACLRLVPSYLSRREGLRLWTRARRLAPYAVQNPVASHGDFALTNIIFEGESLVLTDFETICVARNGFYDLLHLVLHNPVPIEGWSWQRELVRRVYAERRNELGSDSATCREFESALFFLLLFRTVQALTLDQLSEPGPGTALWRWAVGGGRPVPAGGRLAVRFPDMLRMLEAENAERLIQEILGSGPR